GQIRQRRHLRFPRRRHRSRLGPIIAAAADHMRHRRKIFVLLSLSAAAILVWLLAPSNRAKHAAERTLRTLRDKGFKLELSEFDLTATPEQRARADVLINAGRSCVGMLPARELDLVRPFAGIAAVVLHTK